MKKTHSGVLKFKVALAALLGQPVVEICKQYEVSDSLVHKWKKQLKERGSNVFSQSGGQAKKQHSDEVAKLYQQIGRLTTELDFLKKVVGD